MREVYGLSVMLFWMLVLLLVAGHKAGAAIRTDSGRSHSPEWQVNEASYYTLYGKRTACGVTMDRKVMHVSALRNDLKHCRMRVTLCRRGRCVRVRVMDAGAHRTDGRVWDMTPALKRRLKCGDTCKVRWRHGW